MVVSLKQTWTAETYLAFENQSGEKHKFVDGGGYLMAGLM